MHVLSTPPCAPLERYQRRVDQEPGVPEHCVGDGRRGVAAAATGGPHMQRRLDACYDRGSTFRLKLFPNNGAPLTKIVGKKKK